MKKTLSILIFLVFLNASFAQKASLKISNEFEVNGKNFNISGILGSDGKYLYITGDRKGNRQFAKIDENFKVLNSAEIDPDEILKKSKVESVKMVGQNFNVILGLENKKENLITNYLMTVHSNDFSHGEPKNILEVHQKVYKDGNPYARYSDERYVYYSGDSGYMAIIATIPPETKDVERETQLLTMFDKDYNQLWQKELQTTDKYPFFRIANRFLGQNGVYYLIGQGYEEEKDYHKNKNSKALLLTFEKEENKVIELDFKDKEIYGFDFTFKNNTLFCAGFYKNRNDKNNLIEGVAYIKLTPEGKILSESFKEFPDNYIQSIKEVQKSSTQKNKSGEEGLSRNFVVRELRARNDGGFFLFAEESYSYTQTMTSVENGRTRTYTTTYYVFGDKFVCSISPQGQFEWITNIPTNFVVGAPILGDYVISQSEKNIYLFYTDNDENINRPLTQRPSQSFKKGKLSTAIVSIDMSTGKARREKLIDSKDDEFFLLPSVYKTIGKYVYVMGGKIGMFGFKDYKLARITLPK